jgi:hypothetical protein
MTGFQEDSDRIVNAMEQAIKEGVLYTTPTVTSSINIPKPSNWTCYLFGGSPGYGIAYVPLEGRVPNRFVRWMMRICFDCRWVEKK